MGQTLKDAIQTFINKGRTLSVMESCTGGKVCDEITNIEGSSSVFEFGVVAYSNAYKIKMGVESNKIEKYGVYSQEVACEMARSISNFAMSDYGIGVTGKLNCEDIHNPGGENNVVYLSLCNRKINKFYNLYLQVESSNRNENKKIVLSKLANLMFRNIK